MEPKNKVLIFRSTDCSGTIWIDQDREKELRDVANSIPAITNLFNGVSKNSFSFFIDRRYDFDPVKEELLKRLDEPVRREYHIKEYLGKITGYLEEQNLPEYSIELDGFLGMTFLKVIISATGEYHVATWPNDFLKGLLLTEDTVNTWAKSRVRHLVSKFKTLDTASDVFTKYKQAFDFVAEMREHVIKHGMFIISSNYSGLGGNKKAPSFSVTLKLLNHEDMPKVVRVFRWRTISDFHGENLIGIARYELLDMLNEMDEKLSAIT